MCRVNQHTYRRYIGFCRVFGAVKTPELLQWVVGEQIPAVRACLIRGSQNLFDDRQCDRLTTLTLFPWPFPFLATLIHSLESSIQYLHGLESSHRLFASLHASHRSWTSFGPRPTWMHSSRRAIHLEQGRWSSHYRKGIQKDQHIRGGIREAFTNLFVIPPATGARRLSAFSSLRATRHSGLCSRLPRSYRITAFKFHILTSPTRFSVLASDPCTPTGITSIRTIFSRVSLLSATGARPDKGRKSINRRNQRTDHSEANLPPSHRILSRLWYSQRIPNEKPLFLSSRTCRLHKPVVVVMRDHSQISHIICVSAYWTYL